MQKLVIYPFTEKYYWIFKEGIRMGYSSIIGVAPFVIDTFFEKKGTCQYIIGEKQFDTILDENCDLWIVDGLTHLNFDTQIMNKLKKALQKNANIKYLRYVTSEEKESLSTLLSKESISLLCLKNKRKDELYNIQVPILYVLGLSSELINLGELIQLKDSFLDVGYNVALVSNIKEAQYIDNTIYFKNHNLDPVQSVIDINHKIKEVEITNSYDLIIIGLQEGVGQFENRIIEDFGIESYIWSRAVQPDCIVLNVFYGDYSLNTLHMIGKNIEYSVGKEIDFYNLKSQTLDIKTSESQHTICTWPIDNKILQQKVSELNSNEVYSTLLNGETIRIRDEIIEKLGAYGEIERI